VSQAVLTINSANYGAWSLRGWLLCRMANLDFSVHRVDSTDPSVRAELLVLSPSFLVPSLEHDGVRIWDTIAIGEYLRELLPECGLLPEDQAARARCRSICGEMHSGFHNMRAALPMNIRARHAAFPIWDGARADLERIFTIWDDCLEASGGPYLFGERTMADAMYAPVCTRFITYNVEVPGSGATYVQTVMAMSEMREWIALAEEEPDILTGELEVEF
jgi:glutathione S-transferase